MRQSIDQAACDDLQVPVVIIATNMETGEPAALASTAIPGLFPSVEIDCVQYVDGAIMSYCGLGSAWDRGARRILVIEAPHPPPEKGDGILKPALQLALVRLCHLEV